MPVLVPGPASPSLTQRMAMLSNFAMVKVSYKVFPDGESYIRLEEPIKDDVAIIVQSCPPPQDKRIIELLQLIDASLRAGASKVVVIVPYLAYSRQDKVFLNYEALSSKIVARVIESVGAHAFITVNAHSEMVLSYFKIKALSADAFPEIAAYLSSLNLKSPLILSPDKKRYPEAQRVAKLLNAEATFFEKKRDLVTGGITTEERPLNVEDRDVIIIDDIISSGGTVANAARIVSRGNPKRIVAACIHGLYAAGAVDKLVAAGVQEIISTDTIETKTSRISVARPLLESLRQVVED